MFMGGSVMGEKKERVAYNVHWEWEGKPETSRYVGTFKSMTQIGPALETASWGEGGHVTVTKVTTIVEDIPFEYDWEEV
jgi:hypothetical protein